MLRSKLSLIMFIFFTAVECYHIDVKIYDNKLGYKGNRHTSKIPNDETFQSAVTDGYIRHCALVKHTVGRFST